MTHTVGMTNSQLQFSCALLSMNNPKHYMYNHRVNILFDIVAWWKDAMDEEIRFSCAIAIKLDHCTVMNRRNYAIDMLRLTRYDALWGGGLR